MTNDAPRSGADDAQPVDNRSAAGATAATAPEARTAPERTFSWPQQPIWPRVASASVIAGLALVAALIAAVHITMISSLAVPVDQRDVLVLSRIPAQLVGMAVGGVLTVGVSGYGLAMSASVLWIPIPITVVVMAVLMVGSAADEHRRPSVVAHRWILSGLSGLVLSLSVLLLTTVSTLSNSVDAVRVTASAGSPTAGLGALVLGTLASFLGRAIVRARAAGSPLTQRGGPAMRACWSAIGAAALYAIVGLIIAGVAVVIWAVTAAPEPSVAFTGALWAPTAGLVALALMNLSAVTVSGGGALMDAVVPEGALWLPSIAPLWVVVVAIVVALGLIVMAAIALRLRRPATANVGVVWLITVGVFGGLGLLITVLGGATVWSDSQAGGLGLFGSIFMQIMRGTVNIGAAPWTCLIFMVVGAGVEAASRLVAPALIAVMPAPLTRVLAEAGKPRSNVVSRQAGAQATVADDATPSPAPVPSPGVFVDAADPSSAFVSAILESSTPDPLSPERKRAVRTGLIVAGSVVVLAVGGSVAVAVLNDQVFSPTQQVRNYLDAVVAGDASRAMELADISASSSDRVLLSDDVLQATTTRITGYRIIEVMVEHGRTAVEVELDQDGRKMRSDFGLIAEGKVGLVFDSWRLETVRLPSLALDLPEGIDEVVVNEQPIDVSNVIRSESGRVSLPVFPGAYTVALPEDSEWVTGSTTRLLATAEGEGSLIEGALELEPTEALVAEVDRQVDEVLASCAAATTLRPDGCPFSVYAFTADVSDVHWSISKEPTIEITQRLRGGLAFTTIDNGEAVVTYTSNARYFGGPMSGTDRISVEGKIDLGGGAPVVTFDRTWW